MKKMMIAALLLSGLALNGLSQGRPQHEKKTAEERAQMMTDKMATKLSLTADQKSDIYRINLDKAKEMDKFQAKVAEQRKKNAEDGQKIFRSSDDRINKVLNEDQKKAYADLKAKRMDKMKEHHGKKGHRGHFRKGTEGNEGKAES